MALMTCPECGNQISDKADSCVHCGYPIKKRKDPIRRGTVDTFLMIFAIIMMVIGCIGGLITLGDSVIVGVLMIASSLLFGFLLIAVSQILDMLSRIDYFLQENRVDR